MAIDIEHGLIEIACNRAKYRVVQPPLHKTVANVTNLFERAVWSTHHPTSELPILSETDVVFIIDENHMFIRGKNNIRIYYMDDRFPRLIFNKTFNSRILSSFLTYGRFNNYTVKNSGPLEFIFVLLEGEYSKMDLDITVYD